LIFKGAIAIISIEIILLPHPISAIGDNHGIQIAVVVNIGKTGTVGTVIVQYNSIVRYRGEGMVSIIYIKHIVLPRRRPVGKENVVPAVAIHINKIGTSRGGRGGGYVWQSCFLKGL